MGGSVISNSWGRPKCKIAKTKNECAWDIIGYLFYIGSIVFLISVWSKLPGEVPAHYNAVGEVDRWGSKWELLILPSVGLFIIILLQFFEKHPEMHNYPQRFNESNAELFYLQSRKMINTLKNICLIFFALILIESVSIALDWGWGNTFDKWMLPLLIVGTGIPIVIGIMKQRKIQ